MFQRPGDCHNSPLISIVDDDNAARESLEALLLSLGYATAVFASAEEFLSSSLLYQTTVLLSDVQMPGMNGLELQSWLLVSGTRIPIIFITGRSNEMKKEHSLQAGAIGFLIKPVNQNSLVVCLQRALATTTAKPFIAQPAMVLRTASA